MLTIVLLLATGVALLSVGLNSRVYAMRTASDIVARCAADAGLTIALHEMNGKLQVKPWDDSTLPQAGDVNLPYSDGVCSYNVTGDLCSSYIITSNGQCGQIRKFVRATIGLQGLFDHAILTRSTLVLKSGTSVDGYNSQDPLDTDADVDIGTQSTSAASIVLNAGVTVNGDVVVGAGGDPSTVIKDLGATTTGLQYAGTTQDPLPRITAPTDLLDRHADISVQGQTAVLTPAGSGQYSQIVLKQGTVPAQLEITGGDVVLHVTGDIQLGQSCEIIVKEGSTLTLYVDGNIHCRESSGINPEYPTQQVQTLQVYATGESTQLFDLKAKSQWTGVVYAPNASVNLYAGGDVYGAFVADTFEFKAGGNYHYDEALREAQVDDEGVRFMVVRWDEGNLD
jgi:acetyltransferase-like isoleucine patch superfamily enzyme